EPQVLEDFSDRCGGHRCEECCDAGRPAGWAARKNWTPQMIERRQLPIGDEGERWDQGREGPRVAPHCEGLTRETHLIHGLLNLLLHPLRRESRQLGGALHDRVPGVAVDVEAE